ncbi:unnamed protein product [Urochloa decumbens]|uniref:Fungal lipase-type domain-containing protein n=1 Tax=Urochloa decumbens TaxID=240449 RepID=A0ABC8W7L4_9POAL
MAASISGSCTCYPSVGVARGRGASRNRTAIRSSFAPCSPASSKPSTPRIGRKWPELQGVRDWDGLLSPLDVALRGELVRYGEFVRAAYASFDGRARSSYGSCLFPTRSLLRRAGLPETGYQVTRLLHAASTSAPSWLMSPSCSSSYIGYVAVCDDVDEIERLGRRDVVSSDAAGEEDEEPMVEAGFWRLFTAPGEAHGSLQQQVRDEVRRIICEYGGKGMPPLSITVTGHSLGAALAVLSAYEITTAAAQQQRSNDDDAAPMVTAVSFGGPRVGNAAFRRRLEESGGKVLRVVNSDDIVTKVPGFRVDDDCGGEPAKRKARVLPRWLVSKMGWAYSDVGSELRLSSQDQGFGIQNVKKFGAHRNGRISEFRENSDWDSIKF